MESTSGNFASTHRWVPNNETVYRLKPRFRWILLYWFVSIIFMDYINTFGYDRVPMGSAPLPDIGFDAIAKVSGSDAPLSLPFNPTDFATILICASVILLSIYEWKACRNRKLKHLFAIYAVLMNMRTVTIISTTLPIPYAKGPCRDDHRPISNRLLTGLGYAFALGFKQFLSTPQCGDLIFSGHTTFMWIFTLHLVRHASILNSACRKSIVYLLVSIGALYIIATRNHYSVDVVLAIIMSTVVHQLFYTSLQLSYLSREHGTHWTGKLLLWIDFGGAPPSTGSETTELLDADGVEMGGISTQA